MVLQFGFTSDCCLYLMCFDVFVLWIERWLGFTFAMCVFAAVGCRCGLFWLGFICGGLGAIWYVCWLMCWLFRCC